MPFISRDYFLYLEDMQESCLQILRYTQGFTFKQFIEDDLVYDAVLRNIEIIGEAVKHIPDDIRQEHSEIDWRRIAGMRDIVVHHYFSIHNEIDWDVVANKIPSLLEQIKVILKIVDGCFRFKKETEFLDKTRSPVSHLPVIRGR